MQSIIYETDTLLQRIMNLPRGGRNGLVRSTAVISSSSSNIEVRCSHDDSGQQLTYVSQQRSIFSFKVLLLLKISSTWNRTSHPSSFTHTSFLLPTVTFSMIVVIFSTVNSGSVEI